MIEVIYKDEENDNDNRNTGSAVRLPKNVTQIGQGDGNGRLKIYMENQVVKDIKRRSEDGVNYGVLLGKREKDEAEYIFVTNRVEISNNQENIILFNDDIWLYIYDEVKRRGYDGDIVGWYVNFPENRMKNLGQLKKLHLDNFAGINKLLFCYEEENEEEGVYIYNNNMLEKQPVYYIYWGKGGTLKSQEHKKTEVKDKPPAEKSENNNIRKMPWGSVAVIAVLVGVLAFMGNSGMLNSLTDRAKALIESPSDNKLPIVDDVGAENQTTTKKEDTQTSENEENTTETPTENEEETTTETETEKPTADEEETTTGKQDDEASNVVTGTEYIVKQGETLYDICRSFYGTLEMVQKIIEANKLENPDKILVGQKLILPDK